MYSTWSLQEGLGDLCLDISRCKTNDNAKSFLGTPSSFSSLSEQYFFEDRMLRTPGAEDMDSMVSGKYTSSPSTSPSFCEITQAFASSGSRTSTPVNVSSQRGDDNISVGGTSNLSSMRDMFGSESSVFSEGRQDSNLARKAISYCYRLLKQSECSEQFLCTIFF